MARDPRLATLRRTLLTRRAGWGLAAAFALLGIVLGAHRLGPDRLARAARLVGQALADGAKLVLDAGWLLLLLAAAGLALSGPRGRAAGRWLQARLTSRPVRWAAATVGLVVVLVLVVVVLPPRFTAHPAAGDQAGTAADDKAGTADDLKAQNDVRNTLLLALAGGVGILGAYFTYRQLRVTREGQITDRYTKAVDQLGNDHLDVRVGGIYALERIARDSDDDRDTIAEILTAFVRQHSPWPPSEPGQYRRDFPIDEQPELRMRAADVQAALTVLGRGGFTRQGALPLDLAKVDLRKASLGYAHLQGADLRDAHLEGAYLFDAHLEGAKVLLTPRNEDLSPLEEASYVEDAHLEDASYFEGVHLEATYLLESDYEGLIADESRRIQGRIHRVREHAEGRGNARLGTEPATGSSEVRATSGREGSEPLDPPQLPEQQDVT